MRDFTKALFSFLLMLFFFLTGCRDKEFEEHYGRPDWLPDPIYQQLQAKGNFKSFLVCIEKAGYKQTLSGAGYFTVFAPNDAAFELFFDEHGLSGVDAIDSEMARKIVTYGLVYNSFEKARLVDYQSNIGWVPLNSFKRRTAYYTGVYTDTTINNDILKVTSANRNGGYVFADNNNKYIPYFISEYLSAKGLSAFDYNFFYPNTTFTGFNVANAAVVEADIIAENGVIHEVDKVILPLPSIEAYIDHKPQYSKFKELLEKYTVQYATHPEVTNRYQVLTGSNDPVYVKFYSGALGFSPNNENFLKVTDNDGQSDGWSLFVPTDAALTEYINTVLLEHYNSLDEMDPSIINDFINAHMWQSTVWPSKFNNTLNTLGEEARFNPASDIVEAKMLSNGVLYGTSQVQQADVFRSVFGKVYLDPKYSLMTRFLHRELRTTIISPYARFTMFLISDEALAAAGYGYDGVRNEWNYMNSATLAVERWTRLINMHIISQNDDLDDLSGDGIVETIGGEFIKYENNTVYGAGNLDYGVVSNVVNTKQAFNGEVHYLDSILRFPERGVGLYIRDRGDEPGEPYQRFYDYLRNSSLFNQTTGDILGVAVGAFHTFFIPTNAAIDEAVANKHLPGNINPPASATATRDSINNFILYHILPKLTIVHNGKEEGTFESLYKTLAGDPTTLTIVNTVSSNPLENKFTVTDMKAHEIEVINGPASNVLSNRAVIHQIDGYLTTY